jgi:hypothetical protein
MTNIGTLHNSITSTTSDTNREKGYGKTTNGGLGSMRAMSGKGGIYPQVSEWEKELFVDELEGEDEEDVDPDTVYNKARNKAYTSGHQNYNDPYNKNKQDISSLAGPYTNQVSGQLAASYKRSEEKILKEFISTSIRVLVKGTLGDPYHPSTSSTSNINQMNPGDPSMGNYGQGEETPDMWPYVIPGEPTVDGAETTNKLDDNIVKEFPFEDKEASSYTYLKKTSTKEYNDMKNVEKQRRRFRYNQNK